MRKILLGLCLLGGALSLGSSPALAQVAASTVVLSNGGTCVYTGITMQPNGGISVTCSGGAPAAPGAPNIGAASPGDLSASIAFTAGASGSTPTTLYTASCSVSGSAPFAGTGVGASVSPITVSSLVNGTAYLCSVTATNSVGTSPASGTVSVTPIAPVSPPNAPVIGAATPGDGSASIAFSPPVGGAGGITSYTASCSVNGLAPFVGTSGTGASPPLAVTGLTNGTAYLCSVIATNSVGPSPASGTVSVTPAAVVGCGVAPVGTVVATWTGYSNPGNTVETGTIATGASRAYRFTANSTLYPNGSQFQVETSTNTGGSNRADITIAACPGVFTSPQAACVMTNVKLASKLTTFNPLATSECILQNGVDYYVNFRTNVLYPNVAKVLGAQGR